MESSRDDTTLAAALLALRPAPRPEFAAELDERAAAGFPRRPKTGASPLTAALDRLKAMQPRRLAMPAIGTALVAVALATAVVATKDSGSDTGTVDAVALNPEQGSSAGGNAAGGRAHPPSDRNLDFNGAGNYFKASAPLTKGYPPRVVQKVGAGAAGLSAAATESLKPFSADAETSLSVEAETSPSTQNKTGPFASQTRDRDVERAAEMTLGTEPGGVGAAAAKVFEAVHANDGIVLRSTVHDGNGEFHAGASFVLLIPSARLGDALAAFSGIAEVRSRQERTGDITAPTVGTAEQLHDSQTKIDGLLNELAASETETEREAIEAHLRGERRHSAFLHSQLTSLQRRANFSRVGLQIKAGEGASATGEGGGWGIGEALGDAGHILAIAAGVAIVGLAILAPLVLIALLAWLAQRTWVRRSRQRALGQGGV